MQCIDKEKIEIQIQENMEIASIKTIEPVFIKIELVKERTSDYKIEVRDKPTIPLNQKDDKFLEKEKLH